MNSLSPVITIDDLIEAAYSEKISTLEQIRPSEWDEQSRRVYEVMKDGRKRTLWEICSLAGYSPESIGAVSARIREFPDRGVPYDKEKIDRKYYYWLPKV